MNPNKKSQHQPRYKKATVYRARSGDWFYRCLNHLSPRICVYATHAQAVHAAHQHMTLHAPARPVTRLRQTRPRNWRNK